VVQAFAASQAIRAPKTLLARDAIIASHALTPAPTLAATSAIITTSR
jgi:hypothetical protein